MQADPDVGALLPCNVIVREEHDATVRVVFMDPQAMLGMVDRAEIDSLGGPFQVAARGRIAAWLTHADDRRWVPWREALGPDDGSEGMKCQAKPPHERVVKMRCPA